MSNQFLPEIYDNLKLTCDPILSSKQIAQVQHLPSYFDVSGLASASFLAIGEALKSLLSSYDPALTPTLEVDQHLASHWFSASLHLIDHQAPPVWDPIAGDYQCANGWIRLHTNAPHHKAAALDVLQVSADREKVGKLVRDWDGLALETAIVDAGGCAAYMRSIDDWNQHPQGRAVCQEPLIDWSYGPETAKKHFSISDPKRPLCGLKVLDLTRVIAGPVATRTLAGLGAQVLRIDPTDWDEPGLYEELTIGKRCVHLDLKKKEDRQVFEALVAQADMLIHGLRGDALVRLGLSMDELRRINPSLIDVGHNAYGWTGPWANRRGFDSLVQMSAGIADYGMKSAQVKKPLPLPVQALDHATGNLIAAAAIIGLQTAVIDKRAVSARTSLARVAALLIESTKGDKIGGISPISQSDFTTLIEETHLGDTQRLKPALRLANVQQKWDIAAGPLRTAPPSWHEIS